MAIDFYLKQNDTGPSMQVTLLDESSVAINLTGCTVDMNAVDPAGTLISRSVTISDAANGIVQVDWVSADTDVAGIMSLEFQITYADSSIETVPNDGNFTIKIEPELG